MKTIRPENEALIGAGVACGSALAGSCCVVVDEVHLPWRRGNEWVGRVRPYSSTALLSHCFLIQNLPTVQTHSTASTQYYYPISYYFSTCKYSTSSSSSTSPNISCTFPALVFPKIPDQNDVLDLSICPFSCFCDLVVASDARLACIDHHSTTQHMSAPPQTRYFSLVLRRNLSLAAIVSQ